MNNISEIINNYLIAKERTKELMERYERIKKALEECEKEEEENV